MTKDSAPVPELPRLEDLVADHSVEAQRRAALDPRLTEELALEMLTRRDLDPQIIEVLSRNLKVIKRRRVLFAIVTHLRTPRHISLPGIRKLFTFDLMQVALLPSVAREIKTLAEEVLTSRLSTLASGERLTLARRASARIAGELLGDPDERVMQAALLNPYLTESAVVRAIMRRDASAHLLHAINTHPKWAVRIEVRQGLAERIRRGWDVRSCTVAEQQTQEDGDSG